MRERRCHYLPVVEGTTVIGLLAAHDLLKALVLRTEVGEADSELLRRATLQSRRVSDIMQRVVNALPHTATLLDAASELASGSHALPVSGADGRLIGLVTSTDVIQALVDDLRQGEGRPQPARLDASAHDSSEPELRALREVYRAVRNYLASGGAEIEHGRLLKAANRAREAVRAAHAEL